MRIGWKASRTHAPTWPSTMTNRPKEGVGSSRLGFSTGPTRWRMKIPSSPTASGGTNLSRASGPFEPRRGTLIPGEPSPATIFSIARRGSVSPLSGAWTWPRATTRAAKSASSSVGSAQVSGGSSARARAAMMKTMTRARRTMASGPEAALWAGRGGRATDRKLRERALPLRPPAGEGARGRPVDRRVRPQLAQGLGEARTGPAQVPWVLLLEVPVEVNGASRPERRVEVPAELLGAVGARRGQEGRAVHDGRRDFEDPGRATHHGIEGPERPARAATEARDVVDPERGVVLEARALVESECPLGDLGVHGPVVMAETGDPGSDHVLEERLLAGEPLDAARLRVDRRMEPDLPTLGHGPTQGARHGGLGEVVLHVEGVGPHVRPPSSRSSANQPSNPKFGSSSGRSAAPVATRSACRAAPRRRRLPTRRCPVRRRFFAART